jgi:hypothetical protein
MYISPTLTANPLAGTPAPVIIFTGPGSCKKLAAVDKTKLPAEAVILPAVAVRPLLETTGVPVGVERVRVVPAVRLPKVLTDAPVVARVVAPVEAKVVNEPGPPEVPNRIQLARLFTIEDKI